MNLYGPYILLRIYLDAFASNNPIGSSSDKNKILGFYYSVFTTLLFGSKRSTVQTLALIDSKDIEEFTLRVCLKATIADLEKLVLEGIYDEKTQQTIQVRIICCLGRVLRLDMMFHFFIHAN